MNRNLFLLAAALQLPVALWMQGCGKDEDEKNEKEEKDPKIAKKNEHETPPKPDRGDVEDLNRNKKHSQTAQEMIDSKDIKFMVDEHYYNKDIVKASGHIQIMDTDRIAEDKKTLGYHLLGYDFDEWFTTCFEWQSPPDRRGVVNRHQPAVIFDFDIMEEETLPVVIDAKKVSNNISTAAAIIAYDVTPNGIKKKDLKQSFVLVTEIYTNREGTAFNYPAGNNANVLNTFVPMAKSPDFLYDFCYEAMQQIFLFNTMMLAQHDEKELFNAMTKKDGVTADTFSVWHEIEDSRAKKTDPIDDKNVLFNFNIGAPYPGSTKHTTSSLAVAWDVIDDFLKDLDSAVDAFVRTKVLPYDAKSYYKGYFDAEVAGRKWGYDKRGPDGNIEVQRGDPIDGEEGDYVPYDKTIKEHYEQIAFAAIYDNQGLQNKLIKAKDMFDHVYSNNNDLGEMVTIFQWSGEIVEHDAELGFYVLPKDRSPEWRATNYKKVNHHGQPLQLPKFFWERVISVEESAIPASRTANWGEFAEDASADKKLPKYEAPEITGLPGLDSYVVKDVYIHSPGPQVHENFLLAIMFGCYDAFMAAESPRYRGLPDRYVLAEHGRRNRRTNDRHISVKRSTGMWDQKTMRVKQLIFTTKQSQVDDGATDFKALLDATVSGKAPAKVESKTQKPQIRPMSSREFRIDLEESNAPAAA